MGHVCQIRQWLLQHKLFVSGEMCVSLDNHILSGVHHLIRSESMDLEKVKFSWPVPADRKQLQRFPCQLLQ